MWTGTNGLTGTSNGISIAPSDFGSNAVGYDLATFQQVEPNVYQVNNFTMGGGRMWVTYGASSWTIPSSGYTPSLANFNDPNFAKRYDKIEAYIMGSTSDNLDITAVDAFSIPFAVKAYASSSPSSTTQTLKGSPGKSVYDALGAIAANAKASHADDAGRWFAAACEDHGQQSLSRDQLEFAGHHDFRRLQELPDRDQRRLRSRDSQRQHRRALWRRSGGRRERRASSAQLPVDDVQQLPEAHGRARGGDCTREPRRSRAPSPACRRSAPT